MSAAFEISHDWEDPEELHQFLAAIREQRDDANVRKIRYAYFVAEQAHAGQLRTSGEPYITHPLAVARILLDLRMDDDTLCAALLHDVLEDSDFITAEGMASVFGEDVANLVEGVTKLKIIGPGDLTTRQRAAAETARVAETLRKMLLAMAKDFRVMVIKLADRLHNMMTLGHLPPEKQYRISQETLDVYAPLAARLGIWQVKWQLEDLAFKHIHPNEYQEIEEHVARSRPQRERDITEAIVLLKERSAHRGLKVLDVRGRPKHLYSIFNKMAQQKIDFDEVYDLLALRIIVSEVHECYIALGIVHELWVPIPGLFYDYIAKPKPNGYQSLHTKVAGPGGTTLEVQIRTQKMHQIAEYGVAAHWTYKEGKVSADEVVRLQQLREQLFDWSSDARLSSDFLRSISTDLFSEQVFVFTPKGDVIDLPSGSSCVDFAFRVHTQLGMTLVGAKVNGMIVPLSTILKNGDVVELITRSNAQPSLDWLQFVKSAHTRGKLRGYFRKLNRQDFASRGKDSLERELKSQGLDPKVFVGEENLDSIARQYDSCEGAQELLARIGEGLISVQGVVAKLRGITQELPSADMIQITRGSAKGQLTAKGFEGVMVHRAKCCLPIPGDTVLGYISRGRGIILHQESCPNALSLASAEPERMVHYEWPDDGHAYPVVLKIVSMNRQGLLMDISTIFGESKTNVSAAKVSTKANNTAEIEVTIELANTTKLQAVMNKIAQFTDVISVVRLFGRTAAR